MNRQHVKVCCRIRPPLEACETWLDSESSCGADERSTISTTGGYVFQLDHIFGYNSTQLEIFTTIVKPFIDDAITGLNCTLFSYGQTGSGKTFTMQGKSADLAGIIPRVGDYLFETNQSVPNANDHDLEIKMSMLEIYQEKLRDLLKDTVVQNTLRIREGSAGIWVEGLTEVPVNDSTDFKRILAQGIRRRMVGEHSMNRESSRSHLCCTITLRRTVSGRRFRSKVHLIDLAGSEMVRKTDVSGDRLQEAKHINKSLSALGNVIYALTQSTSHARSDSLTVVNTPKMGHIPYRDSKLTRFLQDSLGGNSKIILMLAVAASKEHLNESLATLRFGERARQLSTRPKVNTELDEQGLKQALARAEKQIVALNETVNELQARLTCAEMKLLDTKVTETTAAASTRTNSHTAPEPTSSICQLCKNGLLSYEPKIETTISGIPTSKQKRQKIKEKESSKLQRVKATVAQNEPVSPPNEPIFPPISRAMPSMKSSSAVANPKQDCTISAAEKVKDMEGMGGYESRSDCSDDDRVDVDMGSLLHVDRCTVCGLNEDEAEKLREDTGETLGHLITCDGNCGQLYHVRCVGLIGDGGQFVIPEEGEWLCTSCCCGEADADFDTIREVAEGMCQGTSSSVIERGGKIEGVQASGEGSGELSRVNNVSRKVAALTKHQGRHPAGGDTVTEASEARPSPTMWEAIAASVKAEYHMMRRERNRILMQWQQEKKILALLEERRRETEVERDRELVRLAAALEQAQAELLREREQHESQRLRESSSVQLIASLSLMRASTAAPSDRLSTSATTIGCDSDVMPSPKSGSSPKKSSDRPKKTIASNSEHTIAPIISKSLSTNSLLLSKSQPLGPANNNSSSSSSSSPPVGAAASTTAAAPVFSLLPTSSSPTQAESIPSAGIPKPWKKPTGSLRFKPKQARVIGLRQPPH